MKNYESYRVDFNNFRKVSKWYSTGKGANNAADRFNSKGEHGKVYGLWYDDDNHVHQEFIRTF